MRKRQKKKNRKKQFKECVLMFERECSVNSIDSGMWWARLISDKVDREMMSLYEVES